MKKQHEGSDTPSAAGTHNFQDLTVEKMVEYAENYLQGSSQWKKHDSAGSLAISHAMAASADAVITMLEWRLHGKHGAVDEGQPFTHSLRGRLDWVKARAGITDGEGE